MENPPLSGHFGNRLEDLNRQIHSALRDIRQHIQELEEVARQSGAAGGGKGERSFAALLKQSLDRDPPPTAHH